MTNTERFALLYINDKAGRAVKFWTKPLGRNADGEMTYENHFQLAARVGHAIADAVNDGYVFARKDYNFC